MSKLQRDPSRPSPASPDALPPGSPPRARRPAESVCPSCKRIVRVDKLGRLTRHARIVHDEFGRAETGRGMCPGGGRHA